MTEKHNKRAKQIIDAIQYATLATSSMDGEPWNSPVYFAYDEDFNLYWGSYAKSQHSKNIDVNNKVFIVIYDSTVKAGDGEGVYIKARVEKLDTLDEITKAHKIIQDRRPVFYWPLEKLGTQSPVQLYKAIPENIWMNGEAEVEGIYIDTRIEVIL